MATGTEDFDTIASIIKREIQRRKKQHKKPKDELINCIPISNSSTEDETELILFKKKKTKKREDKIKVQNNKKLKNDKSILTIQKLYTETCDDNDKHSNKDKTVYSNLSKDEFTKKIPIANTSEGDSLFKKKKKKKKRDKIMVQNDNNFKNDIASLKAEKFYTETCNDNNKHLIKNKTGYSKLSKDEIPRNIPIAYTSEGDSLFKKKKKKKKGDKKMVQNDKNFKNDIATLKIEKFYTDTCDDNNKHLIKNKTGYSKFSKDEIPRNIPIAYTSEGDSLFKKKKKKKKGDKKMVQNDENMNNDIVKLEVDKFYIETCDDNDKQLYKDETMDNNFNKDELKRRISTGNASEGDLLLKKKKKKKKLDIIMIQNYENMNNDIVRLKVEKFFNETCDDNDKHLFKDKILDSNLKKDEFTRRIPIANASEGDSLFKKKKKKKNGDKKMVQKDKFLKSDKATLKVKQFRNETCDDNVKHLNKINISASNLNKGLTTRIQIANASEDDEALTLLKIPLKKSKKKKKKSKMAIKEDTESSKYKSKQKNLKNMEDLKKYISEEQSNEIHNDPAMINTPYNSTILKVHEEEYPDLFQKLFKNKKKDKKKSIKAVTIKEIVSQKKFNKRKQQTTDRKYSKNDSLQSVDMDVETYYDSNNSIDDGGEKKLELFDSLDDHTSEYRTMTDTDSTMINTSYNSRISKVRDEEYSELFHNLLKNKKREQKKVIKAVTSKEIISQKKLNKRKQSASDKEYSKNDSPQPMAMVMETYDSNNYIGEDGGKKLEFFDSRDDCTSEHRTMTDTGIYFARYCNQTFNNVNGVHSHENVFTENTPLQCGVCFKTFSCKSQLHKHKRTHTGEKPYACDVCGRSFSKKGDLVRHKRTHTREKPYACNDCGNSFSEQGSLVRHKRTHTGERPYACNICGRSFTQQSVLVVHKSTHTGERPYACNVCGRSFTQQSVLVGHTRTHTGEKPYACDVCGNSFSKQGNLVVHKRTHTGERPYACDVCGRSFTQQSVLVVHKRTHTGERPYACNVCGRSFTQQSVLVGHTRTHTGEKPYACDVCGNSFSKQGNLVVHKRTHTGERPYGCDVCGRSFTQQSILVVHKRTHTGEKPYACDVCGNSFSKQGHLVVHKRTHTGERPYACDVCGRSFTQQSILVVHKRTHTGEKPYACDDCGRLFSDKSTLVTHKRTHTGEKPYECGLCEKKFSTSGNCARHTLNVHTKCF